MFEAYMNYSGYYAGFDWTEEEKLSTIEKFENICDKLGIEIDFGKEPFQTIKILCSKNFRDSMVHGKTYRQNNVKAKDVTDVQSEMDKMRKSGYLSKAMWWTRHLNRNYAIKAYDDVMEIIFKIYDVLCPEQDINEFIKFTENTRFPRALDMSFPTCPTEIISTAIYKETENNHE
jgi:hypothetical protein